MTKKRVKEKEVKQNLQQENNYGIASLILGITSIIFCWIPLLGLATGVLGIIFYQKQKKINPNGIATGGLVTSIIGTVFSAIYTIILLFVILLAFTYM
jgi:hypothetical protein